MVTILRKYLNNFVVQKEKFVHSSTLLWLTLESQVFRMCVAKSLHFCLRKEIESALILENHCYHSVQNVCLAFLCLRIGRLNYRELISCLFIIGV